MASFLRKLVDLQCRSGSVISCNLRSCHVAIKSISLDEAGKVSYQFSYQDAHRPKQIEHKHGFTPHRIQFQGKDLKQDLEFAQKLFWCMTHLKPQITPKSKLKKLMVLSGFERDHASKGFFDENLYLWCSGALTLSGIIFSRQWQRKDDSLAVKLSPLFKEVLTDYFWGVPKDLLILKVNASPSKSIKSGATGAQIGAKGEKQSIEKKCDNDKEKTDLFAEAAENFEKTKEESVLTVLNILGIHLAESSQEKKAAMFFKQAASHGDATALYNVGLCYEHGRGVVQSLPKAKKYYRLAADRGHSKAMYNLASIYLKDRKSSHRKIEMGISFMEAAANQDTLEAQRFLGLHFAKKQAWKKAVNYFKLAAEKKDAISLYRLGTCHESGLGVNKDIGKAGDYYYQAAKEGHKNSQFNVAVFFEKGLGGFEKDSTQATHWYLKAYEQGDEEAKVRMNNLKEVIERQGKVEQNRKSSLGLSHLPSWNFFGRDFHKSFSSPNLMGEISEKAGLLESASDENSLNKYSLIMAKAVL